MKKTVFILIMVATTVGTISAQTGFFPSKEGIIMLYANLNAKGKADMFLRQTVKSVEGSGENMTIVYESHVFDKNMKPVTVGLSNSPSSFTSTVKVTDGVVELDMRSFAVPSNAQGLVEFEGDKLRIPSSLAPGDKLDDAHYIMTISALGIKLRTEVTIKEYECLAIEEVTVPAGTFACYKLTQSSSATIMRKTVVTKMLSWYAHGIGVVKTETYDAKGKLQASMELQSVTKE